MLFWHEERTPAERGERLKVKLQSPGPHAGSFGSADGSPDTRRVLRPSPSRRDASEYRPGKKRDVLRGVCLVRIHAKILKEVKLVSLCSAGSRIDHLCINKTHNCFLVMSLKNHPNYPNSNSTNVLTIMYKCNYK